MAVALYIYRGAGLSLYALIHYFHACLRQIQLVCIFNFVCMSVSNTTGAAFVTVDLWSNSSHCMGTFVHASYTCHACFPVIALHIRLFTVPSVLGGCRYATRACFVF
jgi:hypothetical protein